MLLVDDHAMVRQGLRSILETYEDLEIVGEAEDGEEAVNDAIRLHPDVVLMDVNLPRLSGIHATQRIKQDAPDIVIEAYDTTLRRIVGTEVPVTWADGQTTTMHFIASPEIVTAYALAGTLAFNPLTDAITKADGTKFGKTEGGNVWLDPRKTSSYKFYQYWLNVSDDDAQNFIRIFTLLSKDEIDALTGEHRQAAHLRKLQHVLAKDITIRVHSRAEYEKAVAASNILFGNSTTEELQKLDEETLLSVFEGVPQVIIQKTEFENCPNTLELLTTISKNEIFPSKGEARKMLQAGGVSINKQKVADASAKPDFALLQGRYLLAQKGKKNYYLMVIE